MSVSSPGTNFDPSALAAFIRAFSDKNTAYPDGRFDKGWRIGHPESPRAPN